VTWLDEQGVELASTDAAETGIHVTARKNLTLKDAHPENTGRYVCVAKATVANDSIINVVNVLRINGQLIK